MARKQAPAARRALLLAAVAVWCLGCMDEKVPSCPARTLGIIEGHVLSAGRPVSTRLVLRSANSQSTGLSVNLQTYTDSTGWYTFEAPVGSYFLLVDGPSQTVYYGRNGPLPYWARPDTLRLPGQELTVDFRLGSLAVEVSGPSALEGRELRLVLYESHHLRSSPATGSPVISDGRARFTFPGLCPMDYRMELVWGGVGAFWLPATRDTALAAITTVGTETVAEYSVTLPPPWIIEGEVTGSWQAMHLNGPLIEAMTGDQTGVAYAQAGDDGRYRLLIFASDRVRLRVRHLGFNFKRWMGGSDFASAAAYQGNPGDTVEGGSLVESGIECRIESSEMIWRGTEILLCDSTGAAVTDPDSYSYQNPVPLPGLAPGRYFLQLSSESPSILHAFSQWYENADSLSRATPITVLPGGAVTRITMQIGAPAGVTGGAACAR